MLTEHLKGGLPDFFFFKQKHHGKKVLAGNNREEVENRAQNLEGRREKGEQRKENDRSKSQAKGNQQHNWGPEKEPKKWKRTKILRYNQENTGKKRILRNKRCSIPGETLTKHG